ncbi:hypothetical protein LX92_03067 [Maribacter polysiphoniae]|uniref:Type IV leader peptidase family protein n=1 Tax=Maribacter polysiphoniae TaxID=429344 RepID=A0A316DZ52_9FLAO|nr:hypothetical protein LX92_03067 [Maribacter polysiphoniae]
MVMWIIFPVIGLLLFVLHLINSHWEVGLIYILTNILIISGVLLLLYLYTKHILKQKFLNVSFGLGDILFLYALALGFPTITFIIVLVGSIFFSLIAFLLLKRYKEMSTVPLAGLMGLFLIGLVLFSFSSYTPSLYLY